MKSATTTDEITAEPSVDRGLTWRRLLFIAGMVATAAVARSMHLRVSTGSSVPSPDTSRGEWWEH